jgi:hypothetical protein
MTFVVLASPWNTNPDGQWSETEVGTPQGAAVSPLLANVYLHYVFDLWVDLCVEVWRKKVAKGDVIAVRYADDLVIGFQYWTDAERFRQEFRERAGQVWFVASSLYGAHPCAASSATSLNCGKNYALSRR